VNVHHLGQIVHAEPRLAVHRMQRPDLRTANAHLLFHLLKVRFDRVEHHPELPQNQGGVGGLARRQRGCLWRGLGGFWRFGHGAAKTGRPYHASGRAVPLNRPKKEPL